MECSICTRSDVECDIYPLGGFPCGYLAMSPLCGDCLLTMVRQGRVRPVDAISNKLLSVLASPSSESVDISHIMAYYIKCANEYNVSPKTVKFVERVVSRQLEDNLDQPLRNILSVFQAEIDNTSYCGIASAKNPLDFWTYQEIISQTKPAFIIDIGCGWGGTTLAFAHLCDGMGIGQIIAIDVRDILPVRVRNHPRITFIKGDACAVFDQVKSIVGESKVFIIEDASHVYEDTLNILRLYTTLLKGSSYKKMFSCDYMVVEDTINCDGMVEGGPRPGSLKAVEDFIKENTDFVHDRSRERFMITWNPKGFIRRKTIMGT